MKLSYSNVLIVFILVVIVVLVIFVQKLFITYISIVVLRKTNLRVMQYMYENHSIQLILICKKNRKGLLMVMSTVRGKITPEKTAGTRTVYETEM